MSKNVEHTNNHHILFQGEGVKASSTEYVQRVDYKEEAMMGMDINQQELFNSTGLPLEDIKKHDHPSEKLEVSGDDAHFTLGNIVSGYWSNNWQVDSNYQMDKDYQTDNINHDKP